MFPIYRTPKKATTVPPNIDHAKLSHGMGSAVDYSNKRLSSQFLELPKKVHLVFPTTIYSNKKSVMFPICRTPKKATTVPPDIDHAKMSHGIGSAVDYSNKKLSSQFLELPNNVHLVFPTTIYINNKSAVLPIYRTPKKATTVPPDIDHA